MSLRAFAPWLVAAAACVPPSIDYFGKSCEQGSDCPSGYACLPAADGGLSCQYPDDAGAPTTTAATGNNSTASSSSGATTSATATSTTGTSASTASTSASATSSTSGTVTGTAGTSGSAGSTTGTSSTSGFQSLTLLAGQPGGCGAYDGVGDAARFNDPAQIAYDGVGAIYVADTYNDAIRKVDTGSWTVTTIAGVFGNNGSADGDAGTARFDFPTGVALDGLGHLYVADNGNDTLRAIDFSTGNVTTIAGIPGEPGSSDSPLAKFDAPAGLAWDPWDGGLFVADSASQTLRWVNVDAGTVTTVAGSPQNAGFLDGVGAAARFDGPVAVTADGEGHLFVIDSVNEAIREVDERSWQVTTLPDAGYGFTATSGGTVLPSLAFDDDAGVLFAADTSQGELLGLNLASSNVSTLVGDGNHLEQDGTGAAATLWDPAGLVWAGGDTLYTTLGVYLGCSLLSFDTSTAALTTVAGASNHSGESNATGSAATFDSPTQLAWADGGTLYVADQGGAAVRRISANGTVTNLALGFEGANGVAIVEPGQPGAGPSGTLFAADTGHRRIVTIDLQSPTPVTLAGDGDAGIVNGPALSAQFFSPLALAYDGQGHLYIADSPLYPDDPDAPDAPTIRMLNLDAGTVVTLAGMPDAGGDANGPGTTATFGAILGLALDGRGHLYISDGDNFELRMLDLATGVVSLVGGIPGAPGCSDGTALGSTLGGRGYGPIGLAFGPDGVLYIADDGCSAIRAFDGGAIWTVAGVPGQSAIEPGPLPGRLNQPYGIAVDSSGHLFVSDYGENVVLTVQ